MKGNDEIKDLFSDKLGGFEAKVNPELWGKVASQIGTASTATATGMSVVTKIIIGASAASVITAATIFALNTNDEETPKEQPAIVEVKQEPKQKVTPVKEIEVEPIQDPIAVVTEPSILPVVIEPVVAPDPLISGPVLAVVSEPVLTPEVRKELQQDPSYNSFTEENQVTINENTTETISNDPVLETKPEGKIITEASTAIDVVFPNVFTPNDDGINDFLFIANAEDLDSEGFLLQIIDAKYKTVFTSTDPRFEWNGNDLAGYPVENGTYIAIITSKDKDGNSAKPIMHPFQIRK